jgi:hypothetical protein
VRAELHLLATSRDAAEHRNNMKLVQLQVLASTSVKIFVFWEAVSCSLVEIDRRFRGAYCLHLQGDGDGQFLPEYMAQHRRRQTSFNFIFSVFTVIVLKHRFNFGKQAIDLTVYHTHKR